MWVAGLVGLVVLGLSPNAERFDAAGVTRPFGAAGDALVAPGARWDAVWFLEIAADGYAGARAAFFPLYPLLVRVAGTLTGSAVVGGLLLSLGCLLAALVVLHRLVALDHPRAVARLTVLLVAVFPGAMWFSSLYSESLFLLLSVATLLLARTDRWALAGLAGGLAASSRSAGVVLAVPLVLLWWRSERRTGDAAWIGLVTAGLLAFCLYLGAAGEGFGAPFGAQEEWARTLRGPVLGLADAVRGTWESGAGLVRGDPPLPAAADTRWLDLLFLPLLAGVLATLAWAVRRLPPAYTAYAAAALVLPLSYPVASHPLMSLPRFVAVLWPLHLTLALWLLARPAVAQRVVLAVFVLGLALVSADVARWGFVA